MEEVLTRSQVLEILQGRAATYDFLSNIYRQEVSAAALQGLLNELLAGADDEPEGEGHGLLRDYAQRAAGEEMSRIETELGAEYAALFLNASTRPVHPYESVYTSPERLLMQQARDEVLAEYSREGLSRDETFKEPEDHIAIEFEFMSYLSRKSAEALEAGDDGAAQAALRKQKGFLEGHLLRWVPAFCQDVAKQATSDFYRGIARITADHLSMEGETIDELLAALGGEGQAG